jgi:diguanylate cyclase (GGDEF)-like protein/PAS domain S-box-containing protein
VVSGEYMRDNPIKVLLIEGNPADADYIRGILSGKNSPPFEIEFTRSLHDGLECLTQGRFDIILLNLFLPDSQGIETLTKIHNQAPVVPIVILTDSGHEPVALEAAGKGAEEYLIKGQVDAQKLLRVTRYVIERKRAEQLLQASEKKWRSLVENTPELICTVDRDGKILIYHTVGDMAMEDVIGKSVYDYVPSDHHNKLRESFKRVFQTGEMDSYEIAVLNPNSITSWYASRIWPIKHEGQVVAVTLVMTNITERKLADDALAQQASRDPLTKLYNRRYFQSWIEAEIARAGRRKHTLAILLCDLDNFKAINDTQGQQVGDEVLLAVGRSIQESTRGTDLVFRWGGDEFAVVLSNTTQEGVMIATERIRRAVRKVSEQAYPELDLSIGVALYPQHGSHADELTRQADLALYTAKKGKDKVRIGVEEQTLNEQSVKVMFQPIMDVRSDKVKGYEALSCDPQGKVSILELFKRYNATGQLNEFKRFCFKTQLKAAQEAGLERVFINVDFNMLSQFESISRPPGMDVVLEISELEALHDKENCLQIAKKWRAKGFQFALDDFGANFASLPFISQLIPDYIKLDRSTILQALSAEPFRDFLGDLLVALRKYSTEGIIAEGIETAQELQVVKNLGISLVQGFLVGKPDEIR